MVVFSRVLAGICFIVLMLPLVFVAGCNRDQSSSSQQTSSSSVPASDAVQSSPAAVVESASTAETTTSTTTDTAAKPSTATTATPSAATTSAAPSTGAASASQPATVSQSATITTTQGTPVNAGPENYSQVKVGMTSKEVVEIMGKASRIKQEHQTTEWEYYLPQGGKFELHLQNDKVVSAGRH